MSTMLPDDNDSARCWCGGQTENSTHELYGRCKKCGTLVLKKVYTAEELKKFYGMDQYWHKHQIEKSRTPPIEQRMIEDFHDRIPLWYRILNRHKILPERVLEIGCSHGGFLQYCLSHGIRKATGIEIDENTCRLGKNTFGLEHIIPGLFPDVKLPYRKYDAVCAFDVMEHFHEPVKAISAISDYLREDGVCLIQTPCYRGEGASWEMFLPEEHLYLYDENSARKILEQSGLMVIETMPGLFHYDMFVVAKKAGKKATKISSGALKSTVVIDGLIFQIQAGANVGISRIWKNIIPILKETLKDTRIILLVRGNYDPGIEGVEKLVIPEYCSVTNCDLENDEKLLTAICRENRADLFMSTYYSSAPGIASIQLVYDLIPELARANMITGMWAPKKRAFSCAHKFVAISESTRNDLSRYYHEPPDRVSVAYPAISDIFRPALQEVERFREQFRIKGPYFVMVGKRSSYKNGGIVLESFINSDLRNQTRIVCIGGEKFSDSEIARFGTSVMRIDYTDDPTLVAAYSGAQALIYPSIYEGFGIPVIEAGACGCPVIACRNSSIPEAGGDACVYVNPGSGPEIVDAMRKMLDTGTREDWGKKGIENARRFTWEKMADVIKTRIMDMICGIKHSRWLIRAENLISYSNEILSEDTNKALRASLIASEVLGGADHRPLVCAARAYRESGIISGAIMNYTKALAMCPSLKPLAIEFAEYQRSLGKHEDALKVLFGLKDYYPDDPEIFAQLQKTQKEWFTSTINSSDFLSSASVPSKPLVSIIISTYNSGQFIDECLSDVVSQSVFGSVEVIVIDAASPQDEKSVIMRFIEKYPGIRYYRTAERIGIYAAWNLGIYLAEGKYVFMFSTNDRLRSQTLEMLLNYLESNPQVDLVYGNTKLTDIPHNDYDNYVATEKYGGAFVWPQYSFYDLLFQCRVGPHPMWKRNVHERVGYFDIRYRAIGDQDFWIRLGRKGTLAHIDEFTGVCWLTEDSLSGDLSSMIEIFEIHAKHQRNFLHEQKRDYAPNEFSHLLNEYVRILVVLTNANKFAEAVRFRDRYHAMFPLSSDLVKLEATMIRLKNMLANSRSAGL